MKDPQRFFSLIHYGFSGAALGLLGGLILAIVIYGILYLAAYLIGGVTEMPIEFVLFMGMGWGSLLGAVFSSILGLKVAKK